jgi:hypothetical protein
LPTWRSETHLTDGADAKNQDKDKDLKDTGGFNHLTHRQRHHRHDHKKSADPLPSPPKTDKWSSLLQLQTIVITKPKKEKKRRSTFSFFGNNPNRIAPIDTTLTDMHSHPVADAVINGKVGGQQLPSTPIKRNKKRRSSV